MTKNFLVFFYFSILISCSSKETEVIEQPSDTSQNEPEEKIEEEEEVSEEVVAENDVEQVVSARLLKMIQNGYDGESLNQRIAFIYENNKHVVDSFFSGNQELIYVQKWLYYENGLLSGTEGYLPDGTLTQKNTYEYNDLGRLISRNSSEQQGNYITHVSFTYNDDNTITSTSASPDGVSEKTFYLNQNGLIYREERPSRFAEVTYEDEKVLSLNNNGSVTSFTYDNVNLPLGPFKDEWTNLFGDYRNNIVLWGNSLSDYASELDDRFLLGGPNTYEYVFNIDGYPISRNEFANNERVNEFLYLYE